MPSNIGVNNLATSDELFKIPDQEIYYH